MNASQAPRQGRSPSIATVLSAIWPDVGHAYAGRRRMALGTAVLALLAAVVLAVHGYAGYITDAFCDAGSSSCRLSPA